MKILDQMNAGRGAGVAAVVLVTALTAASGLAYRRADRGISAEKLRDIGEQVADLPRHLGDWRQKSATELSYDTIRKLSCIGYANRSFERLSSGRTAAVLLLAGPSGQMAAHTPEVCYGAREYEIVGTPERIECQDGDGRTHQFWLTHIRRRDASAEMLRVYHAWTADGIWQAPESARLEYTFTPLLCKCQVGFVEAGTPESINEEQSFLRELCSAAATRCNVTQP